MSARVPQPGHRVIPPRPPPEDADARERVLRTAYELFSRHGIAAVGVDRIVAEAGVAKTTLYRHFRSKDALAVAVVERHEALWTRGWLEGELSRDDLSQPRILAIFDAFDDWFHQERYDGCLFTNMLLEVHPGSSAVRAAAVAALGRIYELVRLLAEEADVRDPDGFAHQIHVLMRGAVVAAVEGRWDAVQQARVAARLLFDEQVAPD